MINKLKFLTEKFKNTQKLEKDVKTEIETKK